MSTTVPGEGGRRPKFINENGGTLTYSASATVADSEIQFFMVNEGTIETSSTGVDLVLAGGGVGASGTMKVGAYDADIVASSYSSCSRSRRRSS